MGVAFIQYLVICIIAMFSYFFYFDGQKTYPLNRIVAIAAMWMVFLSPIYFEYADWGDSVPVTFSGNSVIKHPLGTFTSPFGLTNDYANMPTRNSFVRVIMNSSLTEDRKRMVGLTYNFSASISSPEKYYAKASRRALSSSESESELEHIADSVSLAFAISHPNPSTTRFSYMNYEESRGMRDSLRNVFNEWLKTHRSDDGVTIIFEDMETRGSW
ncbi:MAG: hypothetical protein WCW78_03935 [Candidatus Paceibacterota bacterium]|jgi:hypothetical protein